MPRYRLALYFSARSFARTRPKTSSKYWKQAAASVALKSVVGVWEENKKTDELDGPVDRDSEGPFQDVI